MSRAQTAPLSIAFIGGALGSAVGRTHFSAARLDNAFTLVAGCFSTDPARNRETATAFGAARVYDDWRRLVREEQGRLDAIVVLTPTPLHCDMVAAALDAGHAVICEKALAMTAAEAGRLSALRAETGGFLGVTYNYTGYPMVRELRARIAAGELGRIVTVQAEMPQDSYRRRGPGGAPLTPQPWRLDARAPMLHLDLATHLHHLIVYMTGLSPVSVVGDAAQFGHFDGVVDDVGALCRFAGGARGQIWFSKTALGHRNGLRIRIFGEEGAAEWVQTDPERLTLDHAGGRREIIDRAAPTHAAGADRYQRFKAGHPAGFIEAFANLYADFAEDLARGPEAHLRRPGGDYSAERARDGLAFIEAIAASSGEGGWVDVARH